MGWVQLDDIQLWDENPNMGDVGAITEMIRDFGFRIPIALRDNNLTKTGNHRVRALRMLKDEKRLKGDSWQPFGPCIRVTDSGAWEIQYIDHGDLTEAQSTAFAIADNRAVRLGHDDIETLATHLEAIVHDESIRIESIGYSKEDLDELYESISQSPPEDFPEYDDNIETDFCCPKCNYEWSGNPK